MIIRLSRWLVLIIITGVVLVLTVVLVTATASHVKPAAGLADISRPAAMLEPELAKALAMARPDERFNIIIEMREQGGVDAPADGWALDRAEARQRLVNVLQGVAERTQASVRDYLAGCRQEGDVESVRPFWIFNGLAVHGARPEVVRQLAARADIGLIRIDNWQRWITRPPAAPPSLAQLQPAQPGDPRRAPAFSSEPVETDPVLWNLDQIRADEVWHTLGVSGTGVVVANIDTGVDWQHAALQSGYRGYSTKGFHEHEGNWYDATGEGAVYPVDGNGHGSHTMGTLAGQDGIGVAPGARWIAARAFRSDGYAFDSWLHAAFQWLLAPAGNPDLAPHIVNNSWGNDVGRLTTFQEDLDILRRAGILAVFSVGNAGPALGTVGSPASLPGAFSVGASDQDNEVASFSSRGPSPWGEVRPSVVAPGVNVSSTTPGGAYAVWQGTSMAAPHVAGTAALMWSVQPLLNTTQTTFLLTSTATPLSETLPNNHSGYGLIDAYAAVAAAANAGLISGRVFAGDLPLAGALIVVTPAVTGSYGAVHSDAQGYYSMFISAGTYDLSVSAFGYAPAQVHAISVDNGRTTRQDFRLTPLPTGHLEGRVMDSRGEPVEATVSVLGTPVTTPVAAGNYQLNLPGGRYTVEARAVGFRVITASVTMTAGESINHDFSLLNTMRILLVDSGPWYYQSQVLYYRQALDDLSYAYDEGRLKHIPEDVPSLGRLLDYDLVVWSAPADSPGLVGAGDVISDYLASGGNMLLSGQDVAFWDGGGTTFLQHYYADFAHSVFLRDNAPSREVVCSDDSAFSGAQFSIEGGDGADNQRWPDEIGVLHPDFASQACTYAAGRGAVIQVGVCTPHHLLDLGFGFESISDRTDRVRFIQQALDWFGSPPPTEGLELLPQTEPVQVTPSGGVITHVFRLRNTGQAGSGDEIRLEMDGDTWPTSILEFQPKLGPCETTTVTIRTEVPPNLPWNAFDSVTLTARSSVATGLSQTVVFTSKVPAAVLLVDDDRWYDQGPVYAEALQAAGVPYDRWEVTGLFGNGSPPPEVLAWYPVALWFNGYDWFDPIEKHEAERLVDYLDNGGRLFLSSQDALDYVASSELARDYLGVISYSIALTQTAIEGVPANPIGDGMDRIKLDYPFKNWSDSVMPVPGSQVALRGQHGQPSAVIREGAWKGTSETRHWRTVFFPFPFEALPQASRALVMSRLVGWLGWLGHSSLQPDRAVVHTGDTVGFTLTLYNDGPESVHGIQVSNTLPADTLLFSGPDGGAHYEPEQRRVTWSGDLLAGEAVTFTYRLQVADMVTDTALRNTADVIMGNQGVRFQRQALVRIATPDLANSRLTLAASGREGTPDVSASPLAVKAREEISVSLVLRNDGLSDATNAVVNHPLPWPLRLVTETLSSGGVGAPLELPEENRIWWHGEVPIGVPVTLTYRATAPAVHLEGIWVYDAARLEDGQGGAWERGGWLYVEPYRFYFPILH